MPRGGSKPGERRGGRKKGTPNAITRNLREAVLGALEAAGGQSYLEKIAKSGPRTFCTLLGKVLPTQLEHSGGLTMTHEEALDELEAALKDEVTKR